MKKITIIVFFNLFLFSFLWAQEDSTIVIDDSTDTDLIEQRADTLTVTMDSLEVEDVHPQDSPEHRGFIIRSDDDRSELRLRGSVRLHGVFDLNGLQNQNLFQVYDIPVGEANKTEPRFSMSANQTRIGIEALRWTTLGDVFMRIEGDFLEQGNSGNLFRLRHAFGRLNHFLGGLTWSTFGDVASLPQTVDLDGPPSSVSERTIQIRYSKNVTKDLRWAVSVESPKPDIETPDSLLLEPAFQSFPDIVGRVKKYGDWGHTQLALIVRSISVKDEGKNTDYLAGSGLLLSGKMVLTAENEIFYQIVYGSAIARLIGGLTGRGLDVIFNPNTGKFETITSMGGFISFAHHWKENLSSNLTIGVINIRNKDFQPDDAFSFSGYGSLNLFWQATLGSRLGLEYSYGRRQNKNGDSGDANRLAFIVYYDF
jgi:hypothetical protein